MPRHLPQGNEDFYTYTKQLHVNVYGRFVCNIQKLETTQVLTGEWWGSLWNPHYATLVSNKKEQTTNTHNLDESPENDAEWKKPTPKGYVLSDATYNILEVTSL